MAPSKPFVSSETQLFPYSLKMIILILLQSKMLYIVLIFKWSVADLHSKILDARPTLGVQILSISCSFWEILAKSYVGAPPPPPGELAPPPRGNPRSATDGHVWIAIYEFAICAYVLNIPTEHPIGEGARLHNFTM